MIRVLIVDDHPVVRWGFRQMMLTDPELEVVAEIGDGAELLQRVAELRPDVILLDIRLPGMDGVQAVAEVHQIYPAARILILTAFDDAEHLYSALAAGVDGYLLKTAPRGVLLDGIHSVMTGRRVVDKSLMHLVLERFTDLARTTSRQREALTPDEKRLLQLLASGSTVAAIARDLHWSVATVGRRINQLCFKLGVENRAQAVREAARLGLI